MNHAARVRIGKGRQHLRDIIRRFADWNGSSFHHFIERDAFHIFHQHQQLIFNAQRCVQRRNVRMIEAGLNFDFTHEPIREFGIALEIGEQNLHRFHAIG